jgi:hypothetical protein
MDKKMQFQIGDNVKIVSKPKWKGIIWKCWINEPENIQIIDSEYVYVVKVDKPGRQPDMVQTYNFKESELLKNKIK